MSKLPKFDGRDVIASSIAVRNAGDGLSKAMKVEPEAYHIGDKVFVVLECEVANVAHEPIDKDAPRGPQRRKHVLRAGTATLVDETLVKDVLEEQRLKIEQAEGIERLPLDTQVEK